MVGRKVGVSLILARTLYRGRAGVPRILWENSSVHVSFINTAGLMLCHQLKRDQRLRLFWAGLAVHSNFPLISNKILLSHFKHSSSPSQLLFPRYDGRQHPSPSTQRRPCSSSPGYNLGITNGFLEGCRRKTRGRPPDLRRRLSRRVS